MTHALNWPSILGKLLAKSDLDRTEAAWAMTEIMSGDAAEAQIGAFMLALRSKGGLIAFLLVIGKTFAAKKFGHYEATSAIVVSYYWHFVDVVWIGLFLIIYVLK